MTVKERLQLWICDLCLWLMCLVLGVPRRTAYEPPGVFRFVFETRDAGRTWLYAGCSVACSPLSDQLQNAIVNVAQGWLPYVTPEHRRRYEERGIRSAWAVHNPPEVREARAAARVHGKAWAQ